MLHEALLRHTLTEAAGWNLPGIVRFVFLTSALNQEEHAQVPENVSVESQSGSDLGQRLAHALSKKWNEGYRKILFIGTDSPLLGQRDIEAAIRALDDHEVVIGPAADGGYYLIGFSALRPCVFSGIEWGSARVYSQTVRRMNQHAVPFYALQESFDLDTYDDLLRFRRLTSETQNVNSDSSLGRLSLLVDRIIRQSRV